MTSGLSQKGIPQRSVLPRLPRLQGWAWLLPSHPTGPSPPTLTLPLASGHWHTFPPESWRQCYSSPLSLCQKPPWNSLLMSHLYLPWASPFLRECLLHVRTLPNVFLRSELVPGIQWCFTLSRVNTDPTHYWEGGLECSGKSSGLKFTTPGVESKPWPWYSSLVWP